MKAECSAYLKAFSDVFKRVRIDRLPLKQRAESVEK